MQFTKIIHTLLKQHHASWRPNMECTKRKRVLKKILMQNCKVRQLIKWTRSNGMK